MQTVGAAPENGVNSLHSPPRSPVVITGTNGADGEHKYSFKDWQEVVKERRTPAADAASVTSTQRTGPTTAMANGMGVTDFFSPEIFQIVLHNPTTSYQLLLFSQSRFCGENMEFLEKVGEALTVGLTGGSLANGTALSNRWTATIHCSTK